MRIAELRKSMNMTQSDLAKKLDISQQTVSKYENGLIEPDLATLNALSRIFNVSVDYIIENTNEAENEVHDLLNMFRERPEIKVLFDLGKKATKEQVEMAVKIFEVIKS